MITCDYCLAPAERRVHADHLVGADGFTPESGRASLLLPLARYACASHLGAAVGHVSQLVGDHVAVIADAT